MAFAPALAGHPSYSQMSSSSYQVDSDIWGPAGTDTTLADVNNTPVGDSGRAMDIAWCFNMEQQLVDYRRQFDEQWDYWRAIERGEQWIVPGDLGVRTARLPAWRAQYNINYTYTLKDTISATIFDNDPMPTLHATSQEQASYADLVNVALKRIWDREKCLIKSMQAQDEAMTCSVGWLKVTWDPTKMYGGQRFGDAAVDMTPSDNMFVDKYATDLDNATIVMEKRSESVSSLRKKFPKKAHAIRPDGRIGSYAEQQAQAWPEGISGLPSGRPIDLWSTAENSLDLSASNPLQAAPYKQASTRIDSSVSVRDLYIKDTSTKIEYRHFQKRDWQGRVWSYKVPIEVPCYPTGWRLVTFGGGVVLQDVPCPYSRPPYVLFQDIVDPGLFFGRSTVGLLADPQMELNKAHAQIQDNAALMGNSTYLIEKNTGLAPNQIMNVPGGQYWVNPGTSGGVHRVNPPEMPSWIMSRPGTSISNMVALAGVSPDTGAPRGARSGSAVQEAVAARSQRIRKKTKYVASSLCDLARLLLEQMQLNYTTPRMVRIKGNLMTAQFVPFDRWTCRGDWDIEVEIESEAGQTRIARRQEAVQLRQLQILDDEATLDALNWPDRDKILMRKNIQRQHQVPIYPGWPGHPSRGADPSGYSMQARVNMAQPAPPPPMMPLGAPPGGPKPKRPHGPPKPHHGGGKLPSLPGPWGPRVGVR